MGPNRHRGAAPALEPGGEVSPTASLSEWLVRGLGEEGNSQGIRLLFEGLQQPLLNKQVGGGIKGGGEEGGRTSCTHQPLSPQMTYVLLDLAVQELFPELSKVIRC